MRGACYSPMTSYQTTACYRELIVQCLICPSNATPSQTGTGGMFNDNNGYFQTPIVKSIYRRFVEMVKSFDEFYTIMSVK